MKKAWNMFKVNKKDSRATLLMSLWCLYCYLWTYFIPLSNASIVEFEQVIICWVIAFLYRALIWKFSLYCLVWQTLPSKHLVVLFVKKDWNKIKVKNENIRTTSMTSFWCFYYWLWTYFIPFLVFLLLSTLNK